MLAKKKKLSKKEIKQDKLVELYYKSQSYFGQNKNRIYMYAGVLVVVVLAVIFFVNQRAASNEKAGVELSRIMELYDQGSFLEAIEGRQGTNIIGLKRIVDEYGSTENGETAKIYLANSYSMLGRTEEAFKYYEDYSGSIDMFKAASLSGQASYYSINGEYKKAADLYNRAARVSKEIAQRPEYLLQAAINYINAGNQSDAKDLLQTIKDDYKTSSAFASVDRYLVQIDQ
ncbi:MAG: tetratricopeptide repeat protein [Ignavibacterium sp.]|nr:tetratricopeptide repeat protein [Ignavibacterium sp.]